MPSSPLPGDSTESARREDDDLPSPLSTAIFERDFEAAAALLYAGQSLDDLLDEDGSSPLHEAAREGDAELVHFYLHHGCPRTIAAFERLFARFPSRVRDDRASG